MTSLDRKLRNIDDANRILRAHGIAERVHRYTPARPALPYLAFVEGNAHRWPDTMLPGVFAINALTGRDLLRLHRELNTRFAFPATRG